MGPRILWIDIAKLVAIIAVLVDHTYGILYTDQNIGWGSYYSVSLFVLVMGWGSYQSMKNNLRPILEMLKIKTYRIFGAYLFATFIYYIVQYRFWDFSDFINYVIHFNICGPFYYVILYIQLVWVQPLVFKFLAPGKRKNEVLVEFVGLLVSMIVAYLTTKYTNIMSIYGGGGKLLGGSYLTLFYIGMWFGKHCNGDMKKSVNKLAVIFVGEALVLWMWIRIIVYNRFNFTSIVLWKINPPGIMLGIYAILIMILLYYMEQIIFQIKNIWIRKIYILVN